MNFWSFWFGIACSLVGLKWLFGGETENQSHRKYPTMSASSDKESHDEGSRDEETRDVNGKG